MDIERIRGFLMMMRLADKVALSGGSLKTSATDRPKIENIDFGNSLLPYATAEPFQLALGCTFSPEICAAAAKATAMTAVRKRYGFAGAVRCGLIRDPMSVTAGEFFSEDPYLTAQLLKSYGAAGLGFVFTDSLGQGRFAIRTVDERALREIYLYPLIRSGGVAAGLQTDGGYLNGEDIATSREVYDLYARYISDNAMMISQYGACSGVDGIYGNGVYQYGADGSAKREIAHAVVNGEITDGRLNRCVERTLASAVNVHDIYRRSDFITEYAMPDIAIDSSVLLSNDGTLPVSGQNITLFGDKASFADGADHALIPIKDAQKKSGALNVFLLTDYEDGIDPAVMSAVCGFVSARPTVVVLCGCCAAPLIGLEKASAVLFCPDRPTVGQIIEMLTGTAPRGRLPFTWCDSADDYPCNNKKFKARGDFRYESVYNGYLLFNNFDGNVRYPFGHGLDYTEYEIGKLNVKSDGTKINVDFVIKNIGERAGSTVCQAYITSLAGTVYGLRKRLAAFERVHLEKTENTKVVMTIDIREFGVYDESAKDFTVVGGKYRIDIGLSSRDIRASGEAKIAASSRVSAGLNERSAPSYYKTDGKFEPTAPEIERLLKVPFIKKPDEYPELAAPSAAAIKKSLKKAEKYAPKRILPLLRHKIKTTPEKYIPKGR